ncbi:MAG: transcriptional repressor [marine bacterium B5-7]|nr:MAG: transcriptional repressor [marine bacterium B5-7]
MSKEIISSTFPSPQHNHSECVDAALGEAERLCRIRDLRLTPLRKRVFELIWQSHRPVTAYELLDRLVQDGRRAQAPTVYRSLEFLTECGLVHRVESMNAYVGCNQPSRGHEVGFFICEACGDVAELADPALSSSVTKGAKQLGFTVHSRLIEVRGTCRACTAIKTDDPKRML